MYDLLDLQPFEFSVPPWVFTTCSTVHFWILSPDKLQLLCVLNLLCDFENPSRSSSLVARHVGDLFNDSSIYSHVHSSRTPQRIATPRHTRQCLLRQSLHVFEHRLRTQLEFLKQHTPPISFIITVADPSNGISSTLTLQASGHTQATRENGNHHTPCILQLS